MRCPQCDAALDADAGACPACGHVLAPTSIVDLHGLEEGEARPGPRSQPRPAPPPPASDAPFELESGATVAGRYRIVGRLGVGGMGEVYRAEDLQLGATVALKFVSARLASDPAALDLFRAEVRTARQVSHPNVCRVHDIGEVDGRTFLSMEYVDGEDLASLLRRIGRLPHEKALEIARQVCAGLDAAHRVGVLHRDLKPANVMLDGAGRARLTDFGLAVARESLAAGGGRAGTPQYMAPEQLLDGEASVGSDLYSLGVLLYELFTGRSPHPSGDFAELLRFHREGRVAAPSTHQSDLDPAVELALLACLERDPERRPASALAVAAALPGGDPLTAALAMGETPSPELVAASGGVGRLGARTALGLVALSVALVLAIAWLNDRSLLLRLVDPPFATAVLADRARIVRDEAHAVAIAAGGLEDGPRPAAGHAAIGWARDGLVRSRLQEQAAAGEGWSPESVPDSTSLVFWSRSSPLAMSVTENNGRVTFNEPTVARQGEDRILLTSDGRLRRYQLVPPDTRRPAVGSRAVDWSAFFRLAGLDPAAFQPAETIFAPPVGSDRHDAWRSAGASPLHVEAAAFAGQPVWFDVREDWRLPGEADRGPPSEPPRSGGSDVFRIVFMIGVLTAASLFARRNLSEGRGDRRGARVIGTAAVLLVVAQWALMADHARHAGAVLETFIWALGRGSFFGLATWVSYLAVEPFLRRHSPALLVSWTRVLAGRWRDPRPASDFLFALPVAAFGAALERGQFLLGRRFGAPGLRPIEVQVDSLMGLRHYLGHAGWLFADAALAALVVLTLYAVLSSLLRRPRVAFVIFALFMVVAYPTSARSGVLWIDLPIGLAMVGVLAALVYRRGLWASFLAFALYSFLRGFPITLDFDAWYASASVFALCLLAALLALGYIDSTGRDSAVARGARQPA